MVGFEVDGDVVGLFVWAVGKVEGAGLFITLGFEVGYLVGE